MPELNNGETYILPASTTWVMLVIDNISILVQRTDEGVVVDLYPVDQTSNPAQQSIGSCWATFAEATGQEE